MTSTPAATTAEAETVAEIEAACAEAERLHQGWNEAMQRRNQGIRALAAQGLSAGQISRAIGGCLTKSGVRFVLRSNA